MIWDTAAGGDGTVLITVRGIVLSGVIRIGIALITVGVGVAGTTHGMIPGIMEVTTEVIMADITGVITVDTMEEVTTEATILIITDIIADPTI